jgi:hypothetical protein
VKCTTGPWTQAATDYVNLRNAAAGVAPGDGVGYVTSANKKYGVLEKGMDAKTDLSVFQKTVVGLCTLN